jgi:filamentous hemagglutinin family protein
VSVAPPVGGVSHNAFASFDVGRSGADLANASAGARLIVGEVTGTRPSLIEGPVAITGVRANLILANPHGITVDGGSFVNTTRVALATGRVRFEDFQLGPGPLQRNVGLETDGGTIEIGPRGLSGAFASLELIAGRLVVGGPVRNTFTSAGALTRAVLGGSRASFDGSVSPSDPGAPWVSYTAAAGERQGAILLDITPLGSLTSGQIEVLITDRGAGVAHAGSLHANAGDFVLAGSGELRVRGGTSRAAGDLLVAGNRIFSEGGGWSAGRHIEFRSPEVTLNADTVRAGTGAGPGDVVIGLTDARALAIENTSVEASGGIGLFAPGGHVATIGSILSAGQHIVVDAGSVLQRGSRDAPASIVAGGGVLVESAGDISNQGGLIQGATRIPGAGASAGAVTLRAGGAIANLAAVEQTPGVVFGSAGDVVVAAGAGVSNVGSRLLANANVRITAGGTFLNGVHRLGGPVQEVREEIRERSRSVLGIPRRRDGFAIDYGPPVPSSGVPLVVAGGGVEVAAAEIVSQGEIDANGGDVRLRSSSRILNQAIVSGRVSLERTCRLFFCRSRAETDVANVGGVINAAGSVEMKAAEVVNLGGSLLALGDIAIDAPKVTSAGIPTYSAVARTKGLKAWFGDTWAGIFTADEGGLLLAPRGRVRIAGTFYIDGGSATTEAVEASGGTVIVRPPRRDAVALDDPLGLITLFWR